MQMKNINFHSKFIQKKIVTALTRIKGSIYTQEVQVKNIYIEPRYARLADLYKSHRSPLFQHTIHLQDAADSVVSSLGLEVTVEEKRVVLLPPAIGIPHTPDSHTNTV